MSRSAAGSIFLFASSPWRCQLTPPRTPPSSPQRFPPRAEGSVCLLEGALRRAGPRGHRRPPHQRLPLPALPVSRHHVAVALQPHPGVSRRADVAHAHPHRQSGADPVKLLQVSCISMLGVGGANFIYIFFDIKLLNLSARAGLAIKRSTCAS